MKKIIFLCLILSTVLFSAEKKLIYFGVINGSITDYYQGIFKIDNVSVFHNSGTTGIQVNMPKAVNEMKINLIDNISKKAEVFCKKSTGYVLDNYTSNMITIGNSNVLINSSVNIVCVTMK